jgi:periplasmic copper chaperone A
MRTLKVAAAAAVLSLSASGLALAHATLEQQEALVGSTYKATMRVGHGCEGGQATHTVRIQIPEGFVGVKPMPKSGWKLETVEGNYEKPYKLRAETLTKGVREVVWSGGSLPDAHYDEFVVRGTFAAGDAGQVIYFPTVQLCANGAHRWIEIPAAGKKSDDYKEPAPGVKLIDKR